MTASAFGVQHQPVSKFISATQRSRLRPSQFGLPHKAKSKESRKQTGNYPIDTRKRARAALSYSARFASPEQQAQIRARVQRKYPGIGKSAFGVEHPDYELAKLAPVGPHGDKRNTKYVGAAAGGAVFGQAAGRRVGARMAGTDFPQVVRGAREAGRRYGEQMGPAVLARHERAMTAGPDTAFRQFKEGIRGGYQLARGANKYAYRTVKGARAAERGGRAGAALAAAGGVGGLAEYRHRRELTKSAFGVDHLVAKDDASSFTQSVLPGYGTTKAPSAGRVAWAAFSPGTHGALAGRKGKKLAAAGSEIGHNIGGGILGGLGGAALFHGEEAPTRALATLGGYAGGARSAYTNQARGRYKAQTPR